MKTLLARLILLTAFFSQFAHGEIERLVKEGDIKAVEALLKKNPELADQAMRAFNRLSDWSDRPQKIELAGAFMRSCPGTYPGLATWYSRAEYMDRAQRRSLTAQIAELIKTSEPMQKAVVADMTHVQKVNDVETKTLRALPNIDSLTILKALSDAKAIPADTKVAIGSGRVDKLTTFNPADISTVSSENFAQWVLGKPHPELFKALEEYRTTLNSDSKPSRVELTKKMIEFADAGAPQDALALRRAMRDSLVGKRPDLFDNKPKQFLDIDLRDGADLEAARMLHRKNDEWSPGVRGLGDVQHVRWNGVRDRARDPKTGGLKKDWQDVNYPMQNQVRPNQEGWTMSDLLNSNNFSKAPPGHTGIWRTEALLDKSYSIDPRCETAIGQVGTAPAQTKASP